MCVYVCTCVCVHACVYPVQIRHSYVLVELFVIVIHYYLFTELFQELFRQDLLVASLFRNFLLAERIMRSYNCTPLSQPQLPPTYHHPLWDSWDMALDHCLSQLRGIIEGTATYQVRMSLIIRHSVILSVFNFIPLFSLITSSHIS